MGTKDIEIVKNSGLNAEELIAKLNSAFADEWLAYYQYWVGAKVAEGLMRPDVQKELEEHAAEELDHAGRVADRIISLGGTPILEPKEWYEKTKAGYLVPSNPDTTVLLDQNIKGERAAISVYKELFDMTKSKDIITAHMARHIMEEEIEHEQDLEDLVKDISYAKKK
ncbi:Ferritin family protein [Elusimicrobium minutum Pei191]|uniref:Ferritin family protein n=1 Tax=Elusimicrobium minutum (strain Pei191) TaxID=445932 RepID=B2KCV2_ELUMP|nr:ferritin-like domain-containing protein [Elusimicrobium minutum]ACC98348.1 Ferritin family protein [Elusimicrobium minutum Pei191]